MPELPPHTKTEWNFLVKLWLDEFRSPDGQLCGLCGNSGWLDTRGVRSAAGVPCGILRPCICPNGRQLAGRAPSAAELIGPLVSESDATT